MKLIKIDLIPKKPGVKMPKLPLGTIFGVLIILGVGYYLWGIRGPMYEDELSDLRRKKAQLNKRKEAELRRKQDKLDRLNSEIARWENKVNMIKQLIDTTGIVPWTEVLMQLTEIVPKKKIWLTNFRTEMGYKINILGKGVDTVKNVSQFVSNLKKHPFFANIHLNKVTKSKAQSQQQIFDFNLNCTMKKRSE